MSRILLLAISALPLLAQAAPEVQIIQEFESGPDDGWSASGKWRIERDPKLVRSGAGSLRFTMAPPTKWPGPRIRRSALAQKGYRHLKFAVHNLTDETVTLRIRIDDADTKGKEPQMLRQRRKLAPGWNEVSLDLADLPTQSGARRLDPERLVLLILYTNLPKEAFDLVFDHLRYERPAGSGSPGFARRALAAFKKRYTPFADYETKLELLRNLRGIDHPDRPALIGQRVFAKEHDSRLVREARRTLSDTRDEKALRSALEQARRARQETKWRWLDALGRMADTSARDAVLAILESSKSSRDQTAAIRALARPGDADLVRHLGSDLAGTWQLQTARVEALRLIEAGTSFPALAGHLSSPHPSVRLRAHEALVTLSGRDFGDNASLWTDWWKAREEGRALEAKNSHRGLGGYGRYYGIPLVPGRVCFLIDVSGSMKEKLSKSCRAYVEKSEHLRGRNIENRLDLAKAELVRVIEQLDEKSWFNVISYGTRVQPWGRRGPKRATTDARRDAISRVRSLDFAGDTNIHGALLRAFEPDPTASSRATYEASYDTIFLLSDGDPTVGEIADSAHLALEAAEWNRVRRIRINCVGVGRKNSPLLRALAAESGGTYRDLAR